MTISLNSLSLQEGFAPSPRETGAAGCDTRPARGGARVFSQGGALPFAAAQSVTDAANDEDFEDDVSFDSIDNGYLRVVISIDVEEEGLFSGAYAATGCTVRNVALLRKLAPLCRELEFPLTLLCAHTVLTNAGACRTLEFMRDHAGAEIGAHLHHWSTPPLTPAPAGGRDDGPPARTHRLPQELLRERLRTLLRAGREFQGAPLTSFRMGRWDLKSAVRPLLAEEGILVDSSVCPLRVFWGRADVEDKGADHFLAPSDPYWPTDASGCAPLLESPITQLPLHPLLARAWYALLRERHVVDDFRLFAAFSPNPVWHSAWVMRMAARLHTARGGRVLHLFWHSSEMLPGGSPNIPNEAAADALFTKISCYLKWLKKTYSAQGVTLSSLYALDGFPHNPYVPGQEW